MARTTATTGRTTIGRTAATTVKTGRKISPIKKIIVAVLAIYVLFLVGAGISSAIMSPPGDDVIIVDPITDPEPKPDDPSPDPEPDPASDTEYDPEPDHELPHIEELKGVVQNFHYVQPIECSEEEVDLLARLIFREASIQVCDLREAYYVGNVVLNRALSESFPDSLKDVIYQPGQYQCASVLYDEEPVSVYYSIARNLLQGGIRVLDDDIVFQTGDDPSEWANVVFQTEWHYYSTSMYE